MQRGGVYDRCVCMIISWNNVCTLFLEAHAHQLRLQSEIATLIDIDGILIGFQLGSSHLRDSYHLALKRLLTVIGVDKYAPSNVDHQR